MTNDAEQVVGRHEDVITPRPSTKRARKLVLTAVTVLTFTITMFGVAAPAHAATSGPCYSNPSTTCRPTMVADWAPWTSPTNPGPQYWTIKKGTRVDMQCWSTGATRMGTGKWFRVVSQSYPFTRGYVPATAVGQQITVGRC